MFYQFIYCLIFIASLLADRFSKAWAVGSLASENVVICDNLSFTLAWNRGISWGMLQFSESLYFWLLTSLITLVIISFTIYTIMQYRNKSMIGFEMMVLAGAVSNLIDRLWYGAVVDFIEVHTQTWYFPTFNIADSCIVIGVFGIMIKTVYDSYVNKS